MKLRLLISGLVIMTGCTAVKDAMKYDQTVHRVQMADGNYRVFEHPDGTKLMVTPSVAASIGKGLVKGATLGVAGSVTPLQHMESVARKHLDETGRANCQIASGRLMADPQYEFVFQC